MRTWKLLMGLAASTAMVVACSDDPKDSSGSGGDDGTGGATTTTTTTTTASVTTTSTGGSTPTYDQPGAVSINTELTLVDDGNNGYMVNGAWFFTYYEFDGTALGAQICQEVWAFTSATVDPSNNQGCDANGENCTSICPYDDPADPSVPVGTCIGNLTSVTPDMGSYQTDCNFEVPEAFFHPTNTENLAFLEGFFFSFPTEDDLLTGATGPMAPATWGDWATSVESDPSAAGYTRSLQVQFVGTHEDGSLSNLEADTSLFGIGLSNDGGDTDPMAYGHHITSNLYLFTFTSGG